jgi:hypothetical protein
MPLLALAVIATGGWLTLAAGDGVGSAGARHLLGLAVGGAGALGLARCLALVAGLLVTGP